MAGASEPRFCLDVGTRKVCGLLVDGPPEAARVLHFAVAEHPGRAMLDGQVQSVARAAAVVAEVKAALERAGGRPLSGAHVAVAGRSLTVGKARLKLKTGHTEPLTRAEIAAMELQAVREARAALEDPGARGDSHCVGFSLLSSALDGRPLADPAGHRGAELELEVLATFLPRPALESLLEVLRVAGLAADSLTLEPIAAVQLMVPADLRALNLAFVDVGAGTSDIAVTREGRVDAYAMVPLAGDEVTERLAEAFVLDFMRAEALKRSAPDYAVDTPDIFGVPRRIPAEDLEREIEPVRRRWAEACAATIKRLNFGRSPQAVVLAGGGCLLQGASAALAAALDLAPERVGQRPVPSQEVFKALPSGLLQPWAVTPLGIAASALERRGLPFIRFDVNGKPVTAVKLKPEFTAFDALLALGLERKRFHGRPGLATVYTFNGRERVAKGTLGSPCRIFLGGQPAGLDTPLADGASLTFVEAADGQDGSLDLAQALEREGFGRSAFRFNGMDRPFPLEVLLDGRAADDWKRPLPDRSKLDVRPDVTLRSALRREGVDLDGLIQRRLTVTLEGESRALIQRNYRLRLNGREAELDGLLAEGDRVEFDPGALSQACVRDLWGSAAPKRRAAAVPAPDAGALKVLLNGEWAPLDIVERVWMDGREVGMDEPLVDGALLKVERGAACRSVGEALPRLGLGPWTQAGRLQILLNGKPAQENDPLCDGDALDLSLAAAERAR